MPPSTETSLSRSPNPRGLRPSGPSLGPEIPEIPEVAMQSYALDTSRLQNIFVEISAEGGEPGEA